MCASTGFNVKNGMCSVATNCVLEYAQDVCTQANQCSPYQNLNVTPALVSLLTFKAFMTPCIQQAQVVHRGVCPHAVLKKITVFS